MILGKYVNGNYNVMLMEDGTKYRYGNDKVFVPDFPESIDLKICNRCNMMCPMCHEGSTPNGELGDIMNMGFINTLHPYTEVAIGGGNPLEHPQLMPFLHKLKDKKVIANMTVNQNHFDSEDQVKLKLMCDVGLIHGLGISYTHPDDKFFAALRDFPNAVIHIINGVHSTKDIRELYDRNLKVLVLGYKQFRRGEEYYKSEYAVINSRMNLMNGFILDELMEHCNTVSFDNLAIKQLHIQDRMSPEEWDKFYMGNDGGYTMYIDAVTGVFAKSSVSHTRFPMQDDTQDMFKKVRELG